MSSAPSANAVICSVLDNFSNKASIPSPGGLWQAWIDFAIREGFSLSLIPPHYSSFNPFVSLSAITSPPQDAASVGFGWPALGLLCNILFGHTNIEIFDNYGKQRREGMAVNGGVARVFSIKCYFCSFMADEAACV